VKVFQRQPKTSPSFSLLFYSYFLAEIPHCHLEKNAAGPKPAGSSQKRALAETTRPPLTHVALTESTIIVRTEDIRGRKKEIIEPTLSHLESPGIHE